MSQDIYKPHKNLPYMIGEVYGQAMSDVAVVVHQSCIDAGWYTDLNTGEPLERNVPEMLALIHSEISEALEGYRKDSMDSHLPEHPAIDVELADAVIRIFDLCGYLNIDIGHVIDEKFDYNQRRADHKIENRMKAGGKKI